MSIIHDQFNQLYQVYPIYGVIQGLGSGSPISYQKKKDLFEAEMIHDQTRQTVEGFNVTNSQIKKGLAELEKIPVAGQPTGVGGGGKRPKKTPIFKVRSKWN